VAQERELGTEMKPITITLAGETAYYLVLALKEELAYRSGGETRKRVYHEVIQEIVGAIELPATGRRSSNSAIN